MEYIDLAQIHKPVESQREKSTHIGKMLPAIITSGSDPFHSIPFLTIPGFPASLICNIYNHISQVL